MKATVLRLLAVLVLIAAALPGCGGELPSLRELAGLPSSSDPSVDIKPAENKWLLIKNPRFGDVPSEPEYIWVEEDRIPTTLTTLLRGKGAIIASPEIVARYGTPPGGGKVSPRQQVPYAAAPPPTRQDANRPASSTNASAPAALPAPPPTRGFVVFVDTTRIVLDLNANDGLKV